jgi:hypothetical protein
MQHSILRILVATAVTVLTLAAITGVLLLLPGYFALGAMFIGLVLFMVGGNWWRWTAVIGGVLMFSGVLAAALLGAAVNA